jgi:hypothetical protein
MAILYPIVLDGFKFFVNPTKIEVSKRSNISEIRTMAGTIFQTWPDLPDEISFTGMAFGIRSISELRAMENALQKNPEAKEVNLVYKFRSYPGFVRDLTVSANAENPRMFDYSFKFVSRTRFVLDTFPIGQTPGIKTEFDFFTAQLSTATSQILSIPADLANDVNAIYTQMFGKSGTAGGGLGMFIGRPRSSGVLSSITGGKIGGSSGRIG